MPGFFGRILAELADAGIVDQVPERCQDTDGALFQASVGLVEAAAGVLVPVDAVEDGEGLRRVALDGEDIVGAAALGDQLCRLARRG